MIDGEAFKGELEGLRQLMRQKLGVRGRDFPSALARAGRQLPRALRAEGKAVVAALPMLDHPKLARTIDGARMAQATAALRDHLGAIDLADRRKGFWLGVLGSMAFNILLVIVIAVVFLAWRTKG